MTNRILGTAALLLLVWMCSPTKANTPRARYDAPPPDFYQIIITNNLFRPIGWTKPKLPPAFELIATVIKSYGKHKALIRNTRNRKVYYAAVGDTLEAGVTVEKIESRSVTLNETGKSNIYRLKFPLISKSLP